MNYTSMLNILFLVISVISIVLCDESDPPEYRYHIEMLTNISNKQTSTFIIETIKLPQMGFNTAMSLWPLNRTDYNKVSTQEILFMSALGYGCRQYCPTFSMILKFNGTSLISNISDLPPLMPLHYMNENGEMNPILVGDPRLFKYNQTTMMMFISPFINFQEPSIAEVLYNESSGIIYLKEPFRKMSIEHEAGHRQQKNWSPFIYNLHFGSRYIGVSKVFWVYSIFPHRIVEANETISSNVTKTHTLCLTQINTEKIEEIWPYGPIHGGTNTLLVDTRFGKRYISFFHSAGNYMINW